MGSFIDLTGTRFTRLTAFSFENGLWSCVCDCGETRRVKSQALREGRTKSCGCLRLEMTVARSTKHGFKRRGHSAPEYKTWLGMRDRCNNPNAEKYDLYGGRGIRVCPEWDEFNVFLSTVGPRPTEKHSLDRYPNQNGNYEPGNVRWATQKEQCNNTRRNNVIVALGESLTLGQWAERTGLRRETIAARLKRGWTAFDAVYKPVAA